GDVIERVQIARLEQAEASRRHGADFETALALGKLTPVAGDHYSCARQQKEYFLIVAMAVNADAALGLEHVQIHVLERHERLVGWRGGLVSVRVVHPRLDVLSQFAAVAEGEIIGEDVAVMQETEPAVRGFADADLEEIVPPAIEHVELVAVVR